MYFLGDDCLLFQDKKDKKNENKEDNT
jgi:hypothetical protein